MQRWELIIIFTLPRDNYRWNRPRTPTSTVFLRAQEERNDRRRDDERRKGERKPGREKDCETVDRNRVEEARGAEGMVGVIELAGRASQPC